MSNVNNPFMQGNQAKPTCREMLQTILDGEASEEQRNYFKAHMNQCRPCYSSYDLDMAIKKLLQCNCCGGDVPTELIDQIKTQITQKLPL
jgi:mycothiol system anti-sigma-R factor